MSLISSLKLLTKSSFIYGLSGVLSRVIGFLLIPVYTRLLSPADYGVMALIGLSTTILGIFFGMGFSGYVMRSYNEYKDPKQRKEFIGSLVVFQMALTLGLTAAIVLFRGQLSGLLFNDHSLGLYLSIAVLGVWIGLTTAIPTICLQLQNKAITVLVLAVASTLLGAVIPLFLVAYLRMGVLGVFLGTAISQVIAAGMTGYFLLREITITLKWVYVGGALAFGLPLIPHLLSHWAMNYIDRLMLQRYASTAELGLYSVGYNFGMIMEFVVGTIHTAWNPYFYNLNSSQTEQDAKQQIARISTYWFMLTGFICLCICVLGPVACKLMVAQPFQRAATVVPLVALSYFFHGMYFMAVCGLFLKKNTKILPLISIAAAASNIGLNFLLIPAYGMMGAAWATLASYIILFTGVYMHARPIYRVDYEYLRILKTAVLYAIIGIAAWAMLSDTGLIVQLASKTALIACACAIALWCIVFTKEEKQRAGAILADRLKRAKNK